MWFPLVLLLVSSAWGEKLDPAQPPVAPPGAELAGGQGGDLEPPPHDLVSAASSATSSKDAVIVSYESSPNEGDGSYSFSFETSDGVKRAEQGELKAEVPEGPGEVMRGSYSYTGDDGVIYSVTYIADENGFQPVGAHLPTPHPEIVAALEQNKVEEEVAEVPVAPAVIVPEPVVTPEAAVEESPNPSVFLKNNRYYYPYTKAHYAPPVPVASKDLLPPDHSFVHLRTPVAHDAAHVEASRRPAVFYKSNHAFYATPTPIVHQAVVAAEPEVVPVHTPVAHLDEAHNPAIFYKTIPAHYAKVHHVTPDPAVHQAVVPVHTPVAHLDAAHDPAIFYKPNAAHYAKVHHVTPAPAVQIGYFKQQPSYDYNRHYYKQNHSPDTSKYYNDVYHKYRNRHNFAFGTKYGYY